jgi:NADP-dependent 3-hydroxy acid dehydrogenase YdfG
VNTLQHATAVITGAASGLGRALAIALAKQGAQLILIDRDAVDLQATRTSLGDGMRQATTFTVDITKDDDLKTLAATLGERFGSIDMLLHSAGLIKLAPLASASVHDFDRHYQVNVRAPYLLTQLLLPGLIARQGQVVFINSTLGLTTKAGASQYAATKHALKAVADALRAETNDQGLRVLSVFPGSMATPMQEAVHAADGIPYHPERLLQPEDVAMLVMQALTLPRTAELTDMHLRPMLKLHPRK